VHQERLFEKGIPFHALLKTEGASLISRPECTMKDNSLMRQVMFQIGSSQIEAYLHIGKINSYSTRTSHLSGSELFFA
jgi:hypothetical protein